MALFLPPYMKQLFLSATNLLLGVFLFMAAGHAGAQTDTLKVMSYNVLDYGGNPSCQGATGTYHNYLETIVAYTNPDIIGLVKMGSIRLGPNDFHGTAPIGFGDSVLQFALNAAYPDRYAYCTYTNTSQADNMSVLFYNKHKLGFAGITCNYANITDFNTYKLYYKDPALATMHDTTFLYVVLNHTQSGSSNEQLRGAQIAGEMQLIQQHFSALPNMINMGDYNTRYTNESCYQTLSNPTDTSFRFFDPPFSLDNTYTYPANWDNNATPYTANLTTSTRQSASQPNACGTSGGAKSWYDHIFLSPWIAHSANYISYIPNSYRTIGNDGHRLGRSVNDNSQTINTSAPADVIEAIFQMSNKYPVMADLLVQSNATGSSPADPELPTYVTNLRQNNGIYVVNPVENNISIHFPDAYVNSGISIVCRDMTGRVLSSMQQIARAGTATYPVQLHPGLYLIQIMDSNGQYIYNNKILKK